MAYIAHNIKEVGVRRIKLNHKINLFSGRFTVFLILLSFSCQTYSPSGSPGWVLVGYSMQICLMKKGREMCVTVTMWGFRIKKGTVNCQEKICL